MTFTFNTPRKLSPEEANPMNALISRALETFSKGTHAAYLPQQLQTDIQQKQAASQKNIMMAQLLKSLMGGQGEMGQAGMEDGGGESNSGGMGNLKPAILKGILGIDPYLMSPQESQNLKNQGSMQQAAQKKNLETGAYNVTRENLQNKVSMPEPYLGNDASIQIGKDVLSAKLGDKEAKERLIQAATANKLVPEYAGAQLGSMGIKSTKYGLDSQNEAIRQGWPRFTQKIMDHLPADIQKEAERRHNEIVRNINKSREEFLNAGGKRQHVSTQAAKENTYSWDDIHHTAQTRGISENDVIDKLAKKNGMSLDEFMKHVQSENQ